ncbi:hypothetical protein LMH87_001085 [Akanthomyces muscarius]|uniref:BHLH domain-containing protein n=1 Tax=Akanthomyces muscarius TaxID=2231603 RepID=A0A9W8QGC3_AKAMU|nr:hypothetical protein LMH87_001085 [Akanthomyces muscarius]KAJ4155860.1 hypothetical protein LMH87_001085 [Akanthomyces muscarius]
MQEISYSAPTERQQNPGRHSLTAVASSTDSSGSVEYPGADGLQEISGTALQSSLSSTPTDTYPARGRTYWSEPSINAKIMEESTSGNGGDNNSYGARKQTSSGPDCRICESDVNWKVRSISEHPMLPYLGADGFWYHDISCYQQSRQFRPQVRADVSITSSSETSSTANSGPDMHSGYPGLNSPAQHIWYSHTDVPPGGSSVPMAPHHDFITASGWQQSASHDPSNNINTMSMRRSGIEGAANTAPDKKVKHKMRAFSVSHRAKRGLTQQSAITAATEPDRVIKDTLTTRRNVERKYRENLKDCIGRLRAVLPTLGAEQDNEYGGTTTRTVHKVGKSAVLSTATEYILQLEQANRTMVSECQQLMECIQRLEAMFPNGVAGRLTTYQTVE